MKSVFNVLVLIGCNLRWGITTAAGQWQIRTLMLFVRLLASLCDWRPCCVAGDGRQSRSGASRSSSRDNSARRGADESSSLRTFPPSHSPSVSASADDISDSGALSGTKNPMPILTVEEVQKKTLVVLEEFLYNANYKVLVPVHAIRPYGGVDHAFLTLPLDRHGWSPLCPKSFQYLLNRKLSELEGRSGCYRSDKNLLLLCVQTVIHCSLSLYPRHYWGSH